MGDTLRIGVAAVGPRTAPAATCGSVATNGGQSPLFYLPGLRDGLKARGYDNVRLDVVQASPKELGPAIASFVNDGHSLIVAVSTSVVALAKAATMNKPIPILFPDISDPVANGFADSLVHPGHNITGVSPQLTQSTGQRLAYFKEILGDKLETVLAVYDPTFAPSQASVPLLRKAAAELGVTLIEKQLSSKARDDVTSIMADLKPGDVDGFFFLNDTNVISNADIVFNRANAMNLPVMGVHSFMADWGAIASYPSDPYGDGHDLARYVDRIVHGAKPGDMSIAQQRPFLAINAKRAACLGVALPDALLAKADKVIR